MYIWTINRTLHRNRSIFRGRLPQKYVFTKGENKKEHYSYLQTYCKHSVMSSRTFPMLLKKKKCIYYIIIILIIRSSVWDYLLYVVCFGRFLRLRGSLIRSRVYTKAPVLKSLNRVYFYSW